jgi:antitoxin (DNA-binding transcriptional repressor) of toxin-antitoxin stability system
MSYSCSDCEDGVLEAKIRELELEDGETVTVLEDGRAIASKVACSNEECSSHAAEEDGEKERGTAECAAASRRRDTKAATSHRQGGEAPSSDRSPTAQRSRSEESLHRSR